MNGAGRFPARDGSGQSTVMPIRSETDLHNFLEFYRRKRDASTGRMAGIYDRDYMLILVGLNTAFRFSDLRRLTVDKCKDGFVYQRDQKTGKENAFEFNPKVWREIRSYIARKGLQGPDFLFQSRQGINRPLSRKQGYNVLKTAAEGVGIPYKIGTHTLRKTYGYWFYRQTNDIAALQKILNHSDPSITQIYIGLQREAVEEKRKRFVLM